MFSFVLRMYIFACVLVLVSSNPYCSYRCHRHGRMHNNDLCTSFKRKSNEECELVHIGDWFRDLILDTFNEWRSYFSGKANCSNMQVISWNMEMEFIARERGRFCDNTGMQWTGCMRTSTYYLDYLMNDTTRVFQNYADANTEKPYEPEDMLDHLSWDWEGGLRFQTQFGHYPFIRSKYGTTLYASLIYWADVQYVGCAYFRLQTNKPRFPQPRDYVPYLAYNYTFVCVFGSRVSQPRSQNFPAFRWGKPCTNCLVGTRCSSQYEHLCGDLEPIKKAHDRWQSGFWSKFPQDQS